MPRDRFVADLLSDSQLKSLADTPARKCLIRKDHIYLPFLKISPNGSASRMVRANRKQLTLLANLQNDLSIAEAAEKAGLTEAQALYFLKKRDVQDWLRNKAEEAAVVRDWTPGKWFDWGQKVLDAPEGVEIPRAKIEVWREFGDRCVPKPSRNGEQTGPKIEINIDLDKAREALQRQDSIEAQIVSEQKAA